MKATHLVSLSNQAGGPLFEIRLASIAVDSTDRLYVVGDDLVRRYSSELVEEYQFSLGALGWSLLADRECLWIGSMEE